MYNVHSMLASRKGFPKNIYQEEQNLAIVRQRELYYLPSTTIVGLFLACNKFRNFESFLCVLIFEFFGYISVTSHWKCIIVRSSSVPHHLRVLNNL
jgi:hypothetical protein